MTRHLIPSLAAAICVFGLLQQADARKIKRQMFFEPSRRMAFKIPHGWNAKPGLGNRIADLTNDGHGRMHIIADSVTNIKRLIATLHSGANVEDAVKRAVGQKEALITFFDSDAGQGLKGAVIDIGDDGCDVYVVCADSHRDFAPTFLACRELVSNMRCDVEPDPGRWDENFRRVMTRSAFAYLDGRAGCAGVSEEPMRMAAIAKELGKLSDADELESIALGLSIGAETNEALAPDIHKISKKTSEYFSGLLRAELALEHGDMDKAKEMIVKAESQGQPSRLLLAIKIKTARLQNEIAHAEQAFKSFERDICGRSGAMAAYELGRAIETSDHIRARKLFERAIDADPTFIPAYISLGKALIKSGMPASLASVRIKALLSQAPAVARVKDFRRRFEMREVRIATVEKNSHP